MAIKASTLAQLRKQGLTADSDDSVIKAALKTATGAPVSASMLAEAREALGVESTEAPAKATKPKAEAKPKEESKPKVEKSKAELETPEEMLARYKKEQPEKYKRVLAILETTKDGKKPARVRVKSAKPDSDLEFEIKVQDLFQVKYHPDEKAEMRKAARAAARPAKPPKEEKPKAAKKEKAKA